MKIISLNTKKIYDIEFSKQGENQMPCPECSGNRKPQNRKKKSFSFNYLKKTGYCQNCLTSFAEYNSSFQKKEYEKPVWKNKTDLSDGALKYIEKRGISQHTLSKMKIYSDVVYMPQIEKETGVICFPYFLDETLINIKSRDINKNFCLCKNAELIFYNINCINKHDSVIITEGEFDCLSYIEAGFDNCISVPNGAGGKNMEYFDNYVELFDNVHTVYLSVDNDLAGYELRNELLRRIGNEKCKIIELDDCKDANEFLIKYGVNELKLKVSESKYLPIDGIIDVNDNYDDCYNLYLNGMVKGKTINLEDMDNLISWETGRVCVVTGIPGHGKSEFVDFISLLLCLMYGWKIGYFSPENYPFKYHFSKLASKIIGKSYDAKYMSKNEFDLAHRYIRENINFVYPEDDMTFENILVKAIYLVKRFGIKQFIFDPWNKIEHLKNKGESETEYVSRILDKICVFSKKYQVLCFVVAHPTKMKKENGVFMVPNLYDINGSANFFNKVDYGICIYKNMLSGFVDVHIQKVKFKHLGQTGMVQLKYNYINGRYESEFKTENVFDNRTLINENLEFINYNEKYEQEKLPIIYEFPENPPF